MEIENTFAPGDSMNPDGMPIALSLMSVFTRLFTNQFEAIARWKKSQLRVESVPGRQSYSIESAWLEKGEAAPGETLRLRVLVRPYRGTARVEETTISVPDQVARGTTLRVMVSDADWMNRASRGFGGGMGQGGPAGLDPLISLLNRERRNDRLYVGLFVPSPTMLWDDKELPNVPFSQINAIDGRPAPGSVQILRESLASESFGGDVWSGERNHFFEFASAVKTRMTRVQTARVRGANERTRRLELRPLGVALVIVRRNRYRGTYAAVAAIHLR